MTKDKKYMYVGIGLLLVTLILSGVTYAVLTWTSTKTNIGINTDCFTIDYTKGNNITGKLKLLNESDLISDGNQFTIKEGIGISGVNIGIKSTCNIEGFGSIYLNITNISDVFTTGDSNGALKYAVLKNTSTITEPSSINITSLSGQSFEIVALGSIASSDKKLLYKMELSDTEISKYIVVIYVDNLLSGNNVTSATFKGNISAEAEQVRYGETPDYCFNLSNKDETNKTASIGSYNCYEGNKGSYEIITDVLIPEEIDGYTIDTINSYALFGKKLTSVVLPEMVNTIGMYAFSSNQIKQVTLPSSLTTIGRYAFAINQLTNIIIPDSVTIIEKGAFADNQLTNLAISSFVTTIEEGPFFGNPLIGITVDPNNPVYDDRDGCNAIIETATNTLIQGSQSTIIPSSVIVLGNYSFRGVNLTDVTLPSQLKTIGSNAFFENKLTNITIPDTVTTIGDGAFSRNPLTSITVDPNNSVYNDGNDSNAIIETATNTLIQGSQNTIIPSSVTAIGTSAFNGNNLTSITIPDSVTTIGGMAFADNQLTTINIPASVTVINRSLFYGNQLTSITIPDSVTEIDIAAFYGNKLTSIIIPDSVTTISAQAFGYNNLNHVYIGSNSKLPSIGTSVFSSSNSTLTDKVNGITYVDNPNLKVIYNNSGKSFDWNNVVNGNSGTKFVTGTTDVKTSGNITYNAVEVKTGNP